MSMSDRIMKPALLRHPVCAFVARYITLEVSDMPDDAIGELLPGTFVPLGFDTVALDGGEFVMVFTVKGCLVVSNSALGIAAENIP